MTLEELVVDPEFESTLPPLTEEELNKLEENIVSDGKLHSPIILWNNTIVDGHNRYHILQKHPEIELITEQKEFPDRWAVICWIIDHQEGQRNLTEEQYKNLKGKYYEAEKHTHGDTQERNNDGTYRSGDFHHNGYKDDQRHQTRTEVAKKFNTTDYDIKTSYEYSRGIDAIRKEDEQLADDILASKKKVNQSEVRAIGKAKEEDKPGMIAELKRDKPRVVKSKAERDADRELREKVSQSISEVRNGSSYEVTIDDLIELFQEAANTTIYSLRSIINSRKELVANNKTKVIESIDKIFAEMINEIKEII